MALLDSVWNIALDSRLVGWARDTPRRRVVDASTARTLGPILPVAVCSGRWLLDTWRASAVRRIAGRLEGVVRSAPVRASSALVLVVVALSVTVAWDRATDVGLGAAAILSGLALPGLRDGRSWEDVLETRPGRTLHALFAPPSDGAQR